MLEDSKKENVGVMVNYDEENKRDEVSFNDEIETVEQVFVSKDNEHDVVYVLEHDSDSVEVQVEIRIVDAVNAS